MQNRIIGFLANLFLALTVAACGFSQATLENTIEEVNHHYPTLIGPGFVAEKLTIEGDYVVYHYVLDKDQHNIDAFRAITPDEMLSILKSQGPEMKEFIRLVKKCKMGIKNEYRSYPDGETVTCTMENSIL